MQYHHPVNPPAGQWKILFPRSAHFSVLKAIKLLDLEPVVLDLDENYRLSIDQLEDSLDDDIASIFCVAGSTELGAVDPVESVAEISNGIPIHVDAAFGGYVLPFMEDLGMLDDGIEKWDFQVEEVTTISVDPHKMGRSTIPAGCLLFREEYPLKYLSVESPYLTSSKAYTLAGTRDSGAVAGAYAAMLKLGREGYMKQIEECMKNTWYLVRRLKEIGLETVMEPLMNIVAVHHPDPLGVQDEMKNRGFYLSRVKEPNAIRFVVMPHVTRESIDNMIPELEKVIGLV
jgi:tyrosine decarboxylase/aspartate 1-decarboxylase